MKHKMLHVLLADDSEDDCMLFYEAMKQIKLPVKLTVVHDGEQLMNMLMKEIKKLPDVLFLDLNMPRKNGYECLDEIKQNEMTKDLPVIIISTSYSEKEAKILYKNGAWHYIKKPNEFTTLVNMIRYGLNCLLQPGAVQPVKEDFYLRNV